MPYSMACATPISNFEKDLNYQVCMICDSFIVPALLAYGDGGADTCALLSVVLSFCLSVFHSNRSALNY